MGAVWVARHLQLDINVAIKLMKPTYAAIPGWRVRFEREAKAAAQLRIPNIVQVYDYGVDEDLPYIAMELLDGEGLDARLRREGRLTPTALLPIISQVCKGLHSAHEAGFVHRDLKPGNIFLPQRAGEEGVAKILDFGIAKALGPDSVGEPTETGMLLGSPHYMSPEQARNMKQLDHRSDLWSLGVIIFRCLTGRLPFQNGEMINVLVDICTAPIPVASDLVPEISPAMDHFLQRALMRDPKDRFQSALQFAEAFAQVAQSTEGTASIWEAPSPRHAPRRLVATVGVLLALGIVLGLGAAALVRRPVSASLSVAPLPVAQGTSGLSSSPDSSAEPAPAASGAALVTQEVTTEAAPAASAAPTASASAAVAPPGRTSSAGAPRAVKGASTPTKTPRPTTRPKKDDFLNDR